MARNKPEPAKQCRFIEMNSADQIWTGIGEPHNSLSREAETVGRKPARRPILRHKGVSCYFCRKRPFLNGGTEPCNDIVVGHARVGETEKVFISTACSHQVHKLSHLMTRDTEEGVP